MPRFFSRNILACVFPTIIAVLSVYWFRKKRKLKPIEEESSKYQEDLKESNQISDIHQAVVCSMQTDYVKGQESETCLTSVENDSLVSWSSLNKSSVEETCLNHCNVDASSFVKECKGDTTELEGNSTELKLNGFLNNRANDFNHSDNDDETNFKVVDTCINEACDKVCEQFKDSFLESPLTVIYDSKTEVKNAKSADLQKLHISDTESSNVQEVPNDDTHTETEEKYVLSDNHGKSFSKTIDSLSQSDEKISSLVEFVPSASSPSSNPSDSDFLSSVGTSSLSLNEFTLTSPINSPPEQASTVAADSAIGEGEELSVDSGVGSTRGSESRSSGFTELESHPSVKQLVNSLLQSSNSDTLLNQNRESTNGHSSNEPSQYNNNVSCEFSASSLCQSTTNRNEESTFNDKSNSHVESKHYENASHWVYEFELPYELCGRLIGRQGKHVKFIKESTNASVCIKRHPYNDALKLVVVEGNRYDVNNALNQIRKRYPPSQFPSVTLTQTNASTSLNVPVPESLQLHLPECVSVDVILSSMVTAGHFFLQQPTHPTYPSLATLDQCMITCYSQADTPPLPSPIEAGIICAATIMGGWYRAQVMYVFENGEECEIKYVDYGGYSHVSSSSLRQIRSDFMTLPFQASECYLANVQPLNAEIGWTQEASSVFEELAQGQILQAVVTDFHEDGTPYVQLCRVQGISSTFINRELVTRGLAKWVEHR